MVSFIIPAYNEQAWLGRCLSAIRAAIVEYEVSHEIIVVEDVPHGGEAGLQPAGPDI
ncbi:MAG: hypothetical protein JWM59_1517 [Verrucomicrobiales bacterium]|nr:hypothetical protein [Verrucomicrobiales bacterium]